MDKKALGNLGERLAERFLIEKGYMLVQRNWRCRYGEIDLIMNNRGEYVFVEVKFRTNLAFGGAQEAVSGFKVRRVKRAVNSYLQMASGRLSYRIDLVLIDFNAGARKAVVRHLENVMI